MSAIDLTIDTHPGLFITLWLESRCLADIPDKVLSAWARIDAGYCIDARELIPAGGCGTFPIPGTHEHCPEQLHVERSQPLSTYSSEKA